MHPLSLFLAAVSIGLAKGSFPAPQRGALFVARRYRDFPALCRSARRSGGFLFWLWGRRRRQEENAKPEVSHSRSATIHTRTGIAIPKNGYLYIYTSNEATNIDVFFDNLQVTHYRGPLTEETHYYPFGLTMAGITSNAAKFGSPPNKAKFNGIEQSNDFDLNMYDAFYRNLDPQIGRFWQIDPKFDWDESSYVALKNNPISFEDFLGDEPPRHRRRILKILALGINSPYFAGLMAKAGINMNNADKIVKLRRNEYGAYTNGGEIILSPGLFRSKKGQVIDLAHEMTNLALHRKYLELMAGLLGKMTPDEYARGKLAIEDEAEFSQFKVAKELGIRNRMGTKEANELLDQFIRGEYNDEDVKGIISVNSLNSVNPKSGRKVYDIYYEQGVSLKKEFEKSLNPINPPDNNDERERREALLRLKPKNLDSGGRIDPSRGAVYK